MSEIGPHVFVPSASGKNACAYAACRQPRWDEIHSRPLQPRTLEERRAYEAQRGAEPMYDLDTQEWTGTCPCIRAEQRDPECPWHGSVSGMDRAELVSEARAQVAAAIVRLEFVDDQVSKWESLEESPEELRQRHEQASGELDQARSVYFRLQESAGSD